MHDVRTAEGVPIHRRFKQQRRCAGGEDTPAQLLVYLQTKGTRAMGALGVDAYLQPLSSKASLHEGRGEGVFRSSAEDFLSRGKTEAVRRRGGCDRERPVDASGRIAHQEKEALFQLGENPDDLVKL